MRVFVGRCGFLWVDAGFCGLVGMGNDRIIPSPAGGFLSVTSVTSVTNQCFRAFLHFGSVTNAGFLGFERWSWANVYKGCHRVTDGDFGGQ